MQDVPAASSITADTSPKRVRPSPTTDAVQASQPQELLSAPGQDQAQTPDDMLIPGCSDHVNAVLHLHGLSST